MFTTNQLTHSTALIERLLKFDRPADAVTSTYLRENPKLGSGDRYQIAETAFACLRHIEQLYALLGGKTEPRALALATLVRARNLPISELESCLRNGENKWLASLRNLTLPDNIVVQSGLPQWIIDLLGDRDSGDIIRLGRAMMQAAPLDMRINTLKAKRNDVLQELDDSGIAAAATPYSPVGIRLVGKPAVNRHPLFIGGAIEVQDEGSQLLGILSGVRRGEMVVDFCAGAGGKTLQLGAMMASSGRLYAFDVSEKRLAKLKPRLARSGLSNVMPQLIVNENDARIKRLAGKIDRVLIDAPCSGLGTLRRNPDLKYRQNPPSVENLCALQTAILESASRLPKPGGRLVYGTCSILPQENQQIVEAFLAKHPEYSLLPANQVLSEQRIDLDTGDYLQLQPHRHNTDGFFTAVLVKAK